MIPDKTYKSPEELREIIDQFFIDGDDSYECSVKSNIKDVDELRSSISSYFVDLEPGYNTEVDSIRFIFYVHPTEHLDICPKISREALYLCGEFSITLEITDITRDDEVCLVAKNKVDRWLAGQDEDDDGQYIKLSEKTLNFLYALVAYYYGVMKKKAEKEKK